MIERQNEYGQWVPAESLPEPFGVLWGRLWHERRRHGEPKWIALFSSWRDARAISRAANSKQEPKRVSRADQVRGGYSGSGDGRNLRIPPNLRDSRDESC